LIGRHHTQLEALDDLYKGTVRTCFSTPVTVAEWVTQSDLVIGAVAVTGARATKLITRAMVKGMRPGSVLVDVAIDQGGCSETSRVTSHADPVYVDEGVLHYCVSNMPGAVPNTSTNALTNATLPYVAELAAAGSIPKVAPNEALLKGVNTFEGKLTNRGVADACGLPYVDIHPALR
jgi:alanine dehydrogenase